MKKISLTLLVLICAITTSYSQNIKKDILGTWEMSGDEEYTWTFNENGTLIENWSGDISNFTYKFVDFKKCNSRFTETEYKTIINITDTDGESICYGIFLAKMDERHDLSLENISTGMGTLLLEKYFD